MDDRTWQFICLQLHIAVWYISGVNPDKEKSFAPASKAVQPWREFKGDREDACSGVNYLSWMIKSFEMWGRIKWQVVYEGCAETFLSLVQSPIDL